MFLSVLQVTDVETKGPSRNLFAEINWDLHIFVRFNIAKHVSWFAEIMYNHPDSDNVIFQTWIILSYLNTSFMFKLATKYKHSN